MLPAVPAEALPPHQSPVASDSHTPTASKVWMYPSEQMFYNAMKRKGWDASEDDMTSVVAIHNAVNERVWREVMRWEGSMHGQEYTAAHAVPRLVKFRCVQGLGGVEVVSSSSYPLSWRRAT
jgi:cytochrome c heme-lyase